MQTKTFRAANMQEALELIRGDLGPDAAVVHARELGGMWRWITGAREIEVTATAALAAANPATRSETFAGEHAVVRFDKAHTSTNASTSVASSPPSQAFESAVAPRNSMPLTDALFHLFTDFIEADLGEVAARDLIDQIGRCAPPTELHDVALLKARAVKHVQSEIAIQGPIRVTPGVCRTVALVGPTGVGKTTTIAKLAANFRLREHVRVGLITVDTYRIAAVDQLRTYAEIIDLPMEVVSTPREMAAAIQRLGNMDLILLDTAGRTPRDEVQLQELRAMLAEAQPDETHLVLSAVAGAKTLQQTADKFLTTGVTTLLLTKLDEAATLGNIFPLLRNTGLPISYVTDGQDVPDDIEAANASDLARSILGATDA